MRFLHIIKSPEISWNLLRMFYGMGKRGGVEVDDGPSGSATMENDWKLRLILGWNDMEHFLAALNLQVYVGRLNKTVRSNQYNERGSSRLLCRAKWGGVHPRWIPRSSFRLFSIIFAFSVHLFLRLYLFRFPLRTWKVAHWIKME